MSDYQVYNKTNTFTKMLYNIQSSRSRNVVLKYKKYINILAFIYQIAFQTNKKFLQQLWHL